MQRSRRAPETTLAAWLARVGEQPDRRLVEAATDLVETMATRPEGLSGAIYRFGNTLGADGWPIAQVSEWLRLLRAEMDRKAGRPLGHYSAHAALAQGWADGYVRGAHTGMCIDPTTGLVTMMVLRLRLAEVFEQCATLQVPAGEWYSLVIVDSDIADLPALEADLLMACVADSVHDVFHQGETIARAGGRIMVLTARDEAGERRAAILADRLRLEASTRRANATVVVDPIPDDAASLECYLRDLVA